MYSAPPYPGHVPGCRSPVQQTAVPVLDVCRDGISKENLAPTLRAVSEKFKGGKFAIKSKDGESTTIGIPIAELARNISESAGWEWGEVNTNPNPWSNYGTRGVNKFMDRVGSDRDFIKSMVATDEIINSRAHRDAAGKAIPVAAKEYAKAQAAEALRAQATTVPTPISSNLDDFPKPTEKGNTDSFLHKG